MTITGDDLIISPTSSEGKGVAQAKLGEMFDCQMLDSAQFEFQIVGPQNSMRFRAKSGVEARQWVDALSTQLAAAPSPLTRSEPTVDARGKIENATMWGIQVELVETASTHLVLESISIAISPQTTKAAFLSTVSDAIGQDASDVDICAGRVNFYMAKYRGASEAVEITEFMNDGAIFCCVKEPFTPTSAPAPKSVGSKKQPPVTRTTKPSTTHVGLHAGARTQYTHYKSGDEEVTEGLDATVARKLAAKYDLALQESVCAWATSLGVDIDGSSMDSFMACLKDGQLLCQLINKMRPRSVPKINKMKMYDHPRVCLLGAKV